MSKLKMQTVDGIDANVEKIAALFPNCVTEVRGSDGELKHVVDFDRLRQELQSSVVEGNEERYQFTWPDKRKAQLAANAPITATLRPCREESVDFDNTHNLYIEGDNLDVLKCLKETYSGKVKMIYIDPPYNTGNDFVYNDDFAESADEYLSNSGQYDDQGNRLVTNTESNGRFHTDWLNMIYPRLKVARDLLSDDGALFLSIDNNEIESSVSVLNELFSENNCIGIIANINNPKGRSDDKYVATAHEYLLVYAKDLNALSWYGFEPTDEKIIKRYNKVDEAGKSYREIDLRKTGENDLREDRPNLFYYFYYNEKTGEFFPSRDELKMEGFIQIKPQREDGKEGNWRWGLDTAASQIGQLIPKFMPARKVWGVMQKDFLEGRSLVKPTSAWTFKDVNSERGTEEFIDLGFDKRVFPKPKPIGTIERCAILSTSGDKDAIILDFFSGSATTAHAIMQLNAEDGGRRRFIMVQLPERTDDKTDASKAGFESICEIGKERIRRAGKKIRDEHPEAANLDTGFRVLKLADSNMQDVFYAPADLKQADLFGQADNVKADRTPEDLLFQVMLELGVLLDSKIEVQTISNKKVFNVADGFLIACFDSGVTDDVVTAIAKQHPQYAVLRDSSYANDSTATNFEQIFKSYSPNTNIKTL